VDAVSADEDGAGVNVAVGCLDVHAAGDEVDAGNLLVDKDLFLVLDAVIEDFEEGRTLKEE
jgi:hypothetical protein